MKTIAWLVVLVAVAGAAYYYFVLMADASGIVLLEQNDSGVSGKAVLREVNGSLEVTLTMKGQPAGVAQPAHIHRGSCPNPGTVLYPLTFPKDGQPSVTLLNEVSLADLKTHPALAINVHKSVAESQSYVSCGDVVFE